MACSKETTGPATGVRPEKRLVAGWATPTSPAPPLCACAVRKVKGCARRLGVCGEGTGAAAEEPEEWELAEERERFLFQQSGCSFFCSSARI